MHGVLLAFTLLMVACGSEPLTNDAGTRVVTAQEAERLAIVRFNLYDAGVVAVDCDVVSADRPVRIAGWIDTVQHRGYGLVSANGLTPFLTFWTKEMVSAMNATSMTAPIPVPRVGWSSTSLDANKSVLAAAQQLLVGLASDRPENPQLLSQNGAMWLRKASVGQTEVDVMSGPLAQGESTSSFRYWVDAQGGLLRIEARLADRYWSRCDFSPAAGVVLDPPE